MTKFQVFKMGTWRRLAFLVADHTPFPKVIENLASEFGFEFSNGHVDNAVFRAKNKTLGEHTITFRKSQAKQNLYSSLVNG